jgi:hypothetical protein
MDEAELLQFYPTIVYHATMDGSGNHHPLIYGDDTIDQYTLENADDEEKRKYVNPISGECNTKCLLHKDHRFTPFFKEVMGHVEVYLGSSFNLYTQLFDLYVVKSWYNVIHPREALGFRKRESSDISFIYYPEADDNTQRFWISNIEKDMNSLNEVFPGIFSENSKGLKYISQFNYATSNLNSIKPQTGSIILYPSKTSTGLISIPDQKPNPRTITIQGEIKLILKPEVLHLDDGLLSIEHWKKFT